MKLSRRILGRRRGKSPPDGEAGTRSRATHEISLLKAQNWGRTSNREGNGLRKRASRNPGGVVRI